VKGSEADDLFFFEAAVKDNYRMLRSYFRSMSLSSETAEDLVQETCLAAFRLLDIFDRSRPIKPWLRGIAKNKYLEFCRMKKEIPFGDDMIEMIDAQYHYWEDAHLEDTGIYAFLGKCINKLDSEAAKIVELFYYNKLGTQEIAGTCSLNEATVRKRLQRARENLKKCMDQYISTEYGMS